MSKAILQIFTAILILGLLCGATAAAPSIVSDPTPSQNSTVIGIVGETQTFTIPLNETANVVWTENGNNTTSSTGGNNIATLSHVFQSGSYKVTASVEGEQIAAWNVEGKAAGGLSVKTDPSEGDISVDKGVSKTFKVNSSTDNQNINVEWFVEDKSQKKEESVTSSSYDFQEDSTGNFTLKAVISDPNSVYESSTKKWTLNVGPTDNSTGNRIWEEGMPETYTWTAQSYSGFYYDLDSGVSSEEMTITDIGRSIKSENIEYVTRPTETDFEYSKWGSYQIIGFMAEKYFAGYTKNESEVVGDDVSPISDGVLSKILIDIDDKKSANAGDSLVLEEGYSLNIVEVDINGESVRVQLEKDGDVVDEAFIRSGEDYVYEADLGETEDIPIIIAHFGTVFQGGETSAVFIQGLFQLSDDYTEINNGDSFGEMEVTSVSESGITMKNDGNIGLGQDETVEVMGNVSFKTADDSNLRFYPFVEVETGGNGDDNNSLKINVPDKIYAGDTFDIKVTAGGEEIEGANVLVNESSVGETSDDGVVEYTAKEIGTFKITAEKDDYKTANKNINVSAPKEEMIVTVSPKTVYVGDTLNIEVVKAIGGEPIKGAAVSIDGDTIAKTDSDGKTAYTTDKSGNLELSITKEGFEDKEVNVKVKDFEAVFEYSNLVIEPLEVSAGKDAAISINIGNKGNAAGNESVELLINGNVSDSKEVSLDVGNNTTVTFEYAEDVPGTYTVEIGGETATYTVKEKSSLLLYALIAIILLIVGGAAYYFTKGGGDIGAIQEKFKELMKK